MTAPSSFRLGVDLGTSTTIAMLRWPDGRVRQQNLDNAKLNDPKLGMVTGLGDEAFVNRMPSGTSAKDAHYTQAKLAGR